jgi:sugar phosphate isomerase/epimerase
MERFQHSVSRRDFIRTGSGTLAAITLAGKSGLLSGCAKTPKDRIPIGVQLYSVRRECEKDLEKTLAEVAKIGYEGVEFADYYGRTAEQLRKLLDENGLKCCGTHTQLDTLLGDELQKTIEFNKVIGNPNLIVPWLPEEKRKTKQDWLDLAKLFNEIAEKAAQKGMRIGYHNHDFETKPLEGEEPWDILFGATGRNVIMQVDTGNMMSGGGDPIKYLKKYPGRSITVHLKEYSKTNPKAILGEGDMDWKQVLNICSTTGGTEWYIIEEEKDVYPPLECIAMCLKNLKAMA